MLRKLSAAAVAASLATAVAVVPAQAGYGAKTVSVKNNAFSPTSVSIKKGGKVTWKWAQGGVAHNVTPAGGAAGSATSSKKGFTFTKAFPKAGSFKYVCTIHSSMKVTVKVT